MRAAAAAAVMAACAACAVGPSFKRPAPPGGADYGSAPVSGQTAAAEGPGGAAQSFRAGADIPAEWWRLFHSPQLDRLVRLSLKGSPDVAAAQAALRQAHELYLAQRAGFVPSLQAGVGASRSKLPENTLTAPTVAPNAVYTLYTAQLSLAYSPDIFGATRRAVELARAQAQSSRFQLEATYLTLSSNVVVTAIQEASLRGQIAATERLLQLQHEITGKIQLQKSIGTVSNLDVLAQQSADAQTAQTLAPLQKQLGQTRDALSALLGRLPSEEPAERFRLEDLTLPTDLPVTLPSKLIEQRPDVRQAEENLHAASAADGVALAGMLPQFALTGDVGSSALTIGRLFSPYTGFWDLGASLTQTLFDGGALLHRHRAADAALDQAAAQYRAAVILACQNVADTLHALQADADALKAAAAAQRASSDTLALAKRQLDLGTISLVTLLNAEQAERQSELALVQASANRYADTAALFQSLGGGWWNRIGEPQ